MTKEERKRANDLRIRQIMGETLTEAEQAQVDAFVAEVEAEEAARLVPAIARQEREIEALRNQKAELRKLVAEQAAFAARLHRILALIERRRSVMDEKFERASKPLEPVG